MPSTDNLEDLLQAWSEGDIIARDLVISRVYRRLVAVAERLLKKEENAPELFTPEGLVSEAYIALTGQKRLKLSNPVQLVDFSIRLMKRILVDSAKVSAKKKVSLDEVLGLENKEASAQIDLMALHEALDRLAAIDPGQARIVELHFYVGLSYEEIASYLGVSVARVKREWRSARLWLLEQLSEGIHDVPSGSIRARQIHANSEGELEPEVASEIEAVSGIFLLQLESLRIQQKNLSASMDGLAEVLEKDANWARNFLAKTEGLTS